MKTRIAAVVALVMLGTVPISSAMAANTAWTNYGSRDVEATGSFFGLGVHDHPNYDACPRSSAAEGNANQQTRPVKQYGQVSGGPRC